MTCNHILVATSANIIRVPFQPYPLCYFCKALIVFWRWVRLKRPHKNKKATHNNAYGWLYIIRCKLCLFGCLICICKRQVQSYPLCSTLFLCINNLCVNLSCAYISMTKHFAYCINICTARQLERCIRVPEAMEGDMLLYSCCFNPSFDRTIYPRWSWQPCKHK